VFPKIFLLHKVVRDAKKVEKHWCRLQKEECSSDRFRNLIQEESHADGKDEDFVTLATLESSYDPKRKSLRLYLGSPTLVWESAP